MPSRNKTQSKRKSSRNNRSSIPKVLVPRGLASRELEITRTCETLVTVTSGNAAGHGLNGVGANNISFSFALSQLNIYIGGTTSTVNLPNYTEFVALFDQYCIKRVEMIAFYNLNTATNNSGGTVKTASLPVFALVDDYTDAGVVASMTDALQYGNCKLIQFGNDRGPNPGIRHQLSPRPAVNAGDYGALAAPIVPSGTVWMNTQNAEIPHYGIKMYYDNWNTGAVIDQGEIQFFFRYTLGFKQPK